MIMKNLTHCLSRLVFSFPRKDCVVYFVSCGLLTTCGVNSVDDTANYREAAVSPDTKPAATHATLATCQANKIR